MNDMTITQEFEAFQERHSAQIQAEPVETDVEREIEFWQRRAQAEDVTALRYLTLWESKRGNDER